MSTIPITFDPPPAPPYTVVGGTERAGASGISAVLLNRGARYPRRHVFAELARAGFDSIISMECGGGHYEVESLVSVFPQVKFIILTEKTSLGAQINIAAGELRSPLFFVLWNDFHLLYGVNADKIAERLMLPVDKIAAGTRRNWFRRLCTVPVFQNAQYEQLPTAISPVMRKNRFETLAYAAAKEDSPSLFPFQGVGIYDRQRFLDIGGFDVAIESPHWQLADFGLRAWLWGEEIRCTHHLRLRGDALGDAAVPSYDASFWRFFLKNLLPVPWRSAADGIEAHIPLKKLPGFVIKTGGGIALNVRRFLAARRWVHAHAANWTTSAAALIGAWGA